MSQLQTVVLKISSATTELDLSRIGHVKDVSFLNPTVDGSNADMEITINGVPLVLREGDPMLSFGGYENVFRRDLIQLTYVVNDPAGDYNFLVFMNKVLH